MKTNYHAIALFVFSFSHLIDCPVNCCTKNKKNWNKNLRIYWKQNSITLNWMNQLDSHEKKIKSKKSSNIVSKQIQIWTEITNSWVHLKIILLCVSTNRTESEKKELKRNGKSQIKKVKLYLLVRSKTTFFHFVVGSVILQEFQW